jgi:hypothetical protein
VQVFFVELVQFAESDGAVVIQALTLVQSTVSMRNIWLCLAVAGLVQVPPLQAALPVDGEESDDHTKSGCIRGERDRPPCALCTS